MMTQYAKIIILLITVSIFSSGCVAGQFILDNQMKNDRYQLVEFHDNFDEAVDLKCNDQVIATFKDGHVFTGVVIEIYDDTKKFDFKIKLEKGHIKVNFSDMEYLQIIEFPERQTCLVNGINYVDEITSFAAIVVIPFVAVVALIAHLASS
jgi:hypothetical protein